MIESEFKKMFERYAEPIVGEITNPIVQEFKELLNQSKLRLKRLNDATNNIFELIESMDKLYKKHTGKINKFTKETMMLLGAMNDNIELHQTNNESLREHTLSAVQDKLINMEDGFNLIQKENKDMKKELDSMVIKHKEIISNQLIRAKTDISHSIFNAKQELESLTRKLQMHDLKEFNLFCDSVVHRLNNTDNEIKLLRLAVAEALE